MVTIRIIVEGGTSENNDIANNTESLRQSLNSFFSRLLSRDDISIIMGFGYKNAVKTFMRQNSDIMLFVDSDCPSNQLETFFSKLEEDINNPIIIPNNKRKNVFFMIQEMEAWFLKQPECFDKWAEKAGYSRRTTELICEHKLIHDKNIEDIKKPSNIVKNLLKHFFEKRSSNGEKRKLADYGKLKTAPSLLDCLDVNKLKEKDSQLILFKNAIETQESI